MIKKQPFISQFVVYCSRFVVVWHWLILPIFSRLFNKNKRTKPNQEGNPLWLLVFLFNIVDSLAPGKRGSNLIRTAFDTHLPDGYDAHIPWTWWRHLMETFSALLAICAGNSPVPGEFPAQRPVTRSFDIFFDLRLNKRLSKQLRGWWFETPSRPLWRHRNETAPIWMVQDPVNDRLTLVQVKPFSEPMLAHILAHCLV